MPFIYVVYVTDTISFLFKNIKKHIKSESIPNIFLTG